jgi:hypothetical protein
MARSKKSGPVKSPFYSLATWLATTSPYVVAAPFTGSQIGLSAKVP